jgi:hypothetical protein
MRNEIAKGGAFFSPYFQGGTDNREHRATASFPNDINEGGSIYDGRYRNQ